MSIEQTRELRKLKDREHKRWLYHNDQSHREQSLARSRSRYRKHSERSASEIAKKKGWDNLRRSLFCESCRSTRNICFHHNNPETKLFNLTARGVSGRTAEEQWAEIRKCTVVCKSCHAKIHEVHRNFPSIQSELCRLRAEVERLRGAMQDSIDDLTTYAEGKASFALEDVVFYVRAALKAGEEKE